MDGSCAVNVVEFDATGPALLYAVPLEEVDEHGHVVSHRD